jgi:hypothetical protein
MKESMKERFGSSAPMPAISPASVTMIIIVVPEERSEKFPLLDLHEPFV